MSLNKLQIFSTALIILVLIINIYIAANYYNVSSIHLSNNFYWQSVNDVLVDNKVEKVQLYGEGIEEEVILKKVYINGKMKITYQTKRDSYRKNW